MPTAIPLANARGSEGMWTSCTLAIAVKEERCEAENPERESENPGKFFVNPRVHGFKRRGAIVVLATIAAAVVEGARTGYLDLVAGSVHPIDGCLCLGFLPKRLDVVALNGYPIRDYKVQLAFRLDGFASQSHGGGAGDRIIDIEARLARFYCVVDFVNVGFVCLFCAASDRHSAGALDLDLRLRGILRQVKTKCSVRRIIVGKLGIPLIEKAFRDTELVG